MEAVITTRELQDAGLSRSQAVQVTDRKFKDLTKDIYRDDPLIGKDGIQVFANGKGLTEKVFVETEMLETALSQRERAFSAAIGRFKHNRFGKAGL